MSFSWLETATFIAKHIARSLSHVTRELSNVSTVRPKFPMLTINQILGPHSVQLETTLWSRRFVLDRKKSRGKKEKESFYYIYILIIYIYIYIYIYIFTFKPVTHTTKQVLPMLVAYLNNRVLLLMALNV